MIERKQIKKDFLQRWSLDNVNKMSLDEYTNLEKNDSFTYWIEHKTANVLGIGGGSSYKFGIFKRNPESEEKPLKADKMSDSNREYGWYSKYGNTKDEAFQNVKRLIVQVIEYAQSKDFSEIDNIDLGTSYKWKLAYMYAPEESLLRIAQDKAFYYLSKKYLNSNQKLISHIQEELIKIKEVNQDFDEFSDNKWKDYYDNNVTESEFRKWLKEIKNLADKTINTYVNRLKKSIPKELVKNNIFEQNISLFDAGIDEINDISSELKPNGELYKWNISSKVKNEASAAINNYLNFLSEEIDMIDKGNQKMLDATKQLQPLNQILYGPPGTGKTYKTVNKALEIILTLSKEYSSKDDFYKENELVSLSEGVISSNPEKIKLNTTIKNEEDIKRDKLKKVFEYYKKEGQIEFVTFHQSYGYEEFVEGIKAKTVDKNVEYSIESGIFKNLCEKAKSIKTDKKSIYDFDNNINIWKISLGDSQNSEYDYLFDYCIKNNKILLGFGDGVNFTNLKNRDEISKKLNDTEKYSYPPTAINTLKNKMKKGDIVLVSYGNKKLRAIAKITEEYSYIDDENLKSYVQSRGVEWLLIPKEPFSYGKVLKKQFSQMSIYDIKSNVKINDLRNLLAQNSEADIDNNKNYILIIDEINRGNISKIFGELITLVEPSKRIGADEEIRVKLPYSGDREDPFGVPSNLYIIGTMNTADRSIAQIDTALRRRFVFEEMMPNSDLFTKNKDEITDISKYTERQSDLKVNNNINIRLLLNAINERIEYIYDREHTIGHSYFMELLKDGSNTKDKLDEIFRVNIIPLLAEYFYGDWGDIVEILNDDNNYFIEKKQLTYKTKTDRQNKVYTIKNEFSDNGYRNIYDGLNEKPSTDTAMDNDQ